MEGFSNLMTKKQIIEYLKDNFDFFNKEDDLLCEEIGDGNINYVFKVINPQSGKSLVVKQADVLLRSSGRPLDIYRSKIEAEVLKIQDKLYPGSVPKVYGYDDKKALLIMEDISNYKNLRKELLNENIYESLSDNLSDFLGNTLIPMTDLVISRADKKENVKKFTNPELCDITEDLVLTEPYFNYKDRNIITEGLENFVRENLYEDKVLHTEVLKLKDRFQNYSQSLIHGDLHSGSIFVNENGIKVIDPEFSFYGPIGYDVGNVWGNLVFPLGNKFVLEKDIKFIEYLKDLIVETVDKTIINLEKSYDENVTNKFFLNEGFKKEYLRKITDDSFGYAGTEIIRRTVGDSKVEEVSSVSDIELRQKLDKILVFVGIDLIKNREKFSCGKDIILSFERAVNRVYEEI